MFIVKDIFLSGGVFKWRLSQPPRPIVASGCYSVITIGNSVVTSLQYDAVTAASLQ